MSCCCKRFRANAAASGLSTCGTRSVPGSGVFLHPFPLLYPTIFLALLVATRELCCGVSGLIPSTNDFFAAAATAAGKNTTFLLAPRRVKEEEEDDGGSSEKLLLSRRSGAVPLLLQQPLNETPDMAVCRGVAAAATVAAEKLISPTN